MDLLGMGTKVDIEFLLDPQGQRKQIEVKTDESNVKRTLQYIYYDGEDVAGSVSSKLAERNDVDTMILFQVQLKLKKNSRVEHQGIRLEFIGQIGKSRGNESLERQKKRQDT